MKHGFVVILTAITLLVLVSCGSVSTATVSVMLTWTAVGDDGMVGQASHYDIRYYADSITTTNWDFCNRVADEPSPLPSGSLESFVVDGLQPNMKYWFAIKVGDEVPNWSLLSNVSSVMTPDTDAPGWIDDLQAGPN